MFTLATIQRAHEMSRFYTAMKKFREACNHANHPDLKLMVEMRSGPALVSFYLDMPIPQITRLLDEEIETVSSILRGMGVSIEDAE